VFLFGAENLRKLSNKIEDLSTTFLYNVSREGSEPNSPRRSGKGGSEILKPAFLKVRMESALAERFPSAIGLRESPPPEMAATGIPEVDKISGGGLPRGAITEISGADSSGRTSVLLSALSQATARREVCALIDADDAFDPLTAAAAFVDLNQLLWVRCGSSIEHALKTADLLLQGGGFGLVVLDMADSSTKEIRRIPSSYWFRFRRAVENSPTILLLVTRTHSARSCAWLSLEMSRTDERWSPQLTGIHEPAQDYVATPGPSHSHLLRGLCVRAERQRPVRPGDREIGFETGVRF
jgi:recombination protein RecA